MTLEEAIKYHLDIAKEQEKCADFSVSDHAKERIRKSAAENKQLSTWLSELKKARKLLKLAVEGFEYVKPYMSRCDGHCNNCPFENEGWCRVDWKYADEAEKLSREAYRRCTDET